MGESSKVCLQIVLKSSSSARIGKPDILWYVNHLARASTKWNTSTHKRWARLISHVHFNSMRVASEPPKYRQRFQFQKLQLEQKNGTTFQKQKQKCPKEKLHMRQTKKHVHRTSPSKKDGFESRAPMPSTETTAVSCRRWPCSSKRVSCRRCTLNPLGRLLRHRASLVSQTASVSTIGTELALIRPQSGPQTFVANALNLYICPSSKSFTKPNSAASTATLALRDPRQELNANVEFYRKAAPSEIVFPTTFSVLDSLESVSRSTANAAANLRSDLFQSPVWRTRTA